MAELPAAERGGWLAPLAAAAVGVVGLVNAVSALTPTLGWEGHPLLHLEPVRFVPLFHALALPASAGLIVAAIYLGRRRRRAWHLAFSSLVALGALNLLKGLDLEESLLSFATAGLLWWGREAFYVRHDPLTLRSAVGRVAGVGLAIVALAGSAALAVAPSRARLRLVGWGAADLPLWSCGPLHL